MPYWDWARGVDNGPVPDFFTTQRIEVTYPDGSKELIWNPLYAFYFHPLTPEGFSEKARLMLNHPMTLIMCSGDTSMQPNDGPRPMLSIPFLTKLQCLKVTRSSSVAYKIT
jgi:hypothetical protein